MVDFLTGEQRDSLIELYIAYFNRAPESGGLSFHANAVIEDLNAGLDFQAALNNRADNFFSAAIDLGVYSNAMTADEFVAEVYENTLLRPGVGGDAPTEAELSYWTARLESGEIGRGDLVTEFLDSIDFLIENGTDDEVAVATQVNAVLENRVEVARVFSMPENSGGLTGQEAINAGTAAIADVDGTQESVDAAIQNIEEGSVGVDGDTFTLTANVDDVTGTTGDDTFNAILGGANNSINTFDNVDGGAGVDTMNIVVEANVAVNANADIDGVEVVNVEQTAAVAANLNSASFGGVEQLWQVGNHTGVTVGTGVTAGFRGDANVVNDTVTVADGVNEVSIALDGVADTSAVTFAETTAGDLETVDVSGDVVSSDDGVADLTLTAVGTETALNLNITSDSQIDVSSFVGVTTLDASASTGDLAVDASAITALESFMGGEGADDLSIDTAVLTADNLAVDGGVGNDTLDVTAGAPAGAQEAAVSLTGGEGNDTFFFDALENVVDETDLTSSLITVADFDADEDVIDVSNLGPRDTLTNTELADIAAAGSLEDALDLAATATTDGQYSVFNYEGDAYIYNNLDVDGAGPNAQMFEAGDGLVQVTGMSTTDIDAGVNFVA